MVRPRRQRQRQPSFSEDNPEFFKVFLPNTCSHEIVLSLFLDIVPIMLTLFYFKYFIEASVFIVPVSSLYQPSLYVFVQNSSRFWWGKMLWEHCMYLCKVLRSYESIEVLSLPFPPPIFAYKLII